MMRTLAFVGLMATTALGLAKPFEKYEIMANPLTWQVNAFNNGTMVNLTGTVQEVYAQIVKINPDFKINVPAQKFDGVPGDNPEDKKDTPYAVCYDSLHNYYGWNAVEVAVIQDGEAYLRGVPGQPGASPGIGMCGRVSCSYKSAIYWCSDHPEGFSLPSFGAIADCAQIVLDNCAFNNYYQIPVVLGQHFMPDGWNCVVRQDTDNC